MSTIKITQLPLIERLNANTSNTVFVAVDAQAEITGKFTATTLAAGLYANNVLNVGNNAITLPNTVAQFALRAESYVQTNFINLSNGGTADHVITANTGTDSTYFVDMGFANKDYIPGSEFNNIGTAIEPMSGYLYVQGNTSGHIGGNLIVGTTSSNTETRFIAGGGTSANVIAKVTPDGLRLVNGKTLTFDDGSVQNTAAATLAYTVAAFTLANTNSNNIVYQTGVDVTQNTVSVAINSYAQSAFALANTNANTITYQAGVDITQNTTAIAINSYAQSAFTLANTNSNSIVYQTGVDVTQNTNIQSAWNKANNALANTSGAVFAGDLNITGNLTTIAIAATGQLTVNTALTSATQAAVRITGSNNASVIEPQNDGYMLQITGKPNLPTRLVLDSFGANTYGLLAGRSARGTAAVPTATQSGDVLLRLAGNGYGTTGFAPLGVSRIDIVAAENFTDAARGSKIEFYNVPDGSNTVTKIASFNANDVEFTGTIKPDKGFIYTPTVLVGAQTAFTINFATTSLIKATLTADLTISLSNYVYGKIVEVWLTNTGGLTRTVTHGCTATNSSENSATFTMPATSSAYLRYFSIDGDNANTFVAIQHA